jgi:hypothetical protein
VQRAAPGFLRFAIGGGAPIAAFYPQLSQMNSMLWAISGGPKSSAKRITDPKPVPSADAVSGDDPGRPETDVRDEPVGVEALDVLMDHGVLLRELAGSSSTSASFDLWDQGFPLAIITSRDEILLAERRGFDEYGVAPSSESATPVLQAVLRGQAQEGVCAIAASYLASSEKHDSDRPLSRTRTKRHTFPGSVVRFCFVTLTGAFAVVLVPCLLPAFALRSAKREEMSCTKAMYFSISSAWNDGERSPRQLHQYALL